MVNILNPTNKTLKLNDERVVRLSEGAFNQSRMFHLSYDPKTESIMDVKTYLAIEKSDPEINDSLSLSWIRTGRYGVYARDFEKDFSLEIGSEILFAVDYGEYLFQIPDVRHPGDKNKGLREASGLLDFDITKLSYDHTRMTVSVSSDFNPETDVRVVDIARGVKILDNFGLMDAHGYPIRSANPPDSDNENAIQVEYLSEGTFTRDEHVNRSTGWHGSIAVLTDCCMVSIASMWADESEVAVISKEKNPSEFGIVRQSSGSLLVRGTPEQLEAAVRLLEQLK